MRHEMWDTTNLSILTLLDFHSSQDLTIYLPLNVEMKKGETQVIYESKRPFEVLADTCYDAILGH